MNYRLGKLLMDNGALELFLNDLLVLFMDYWFSNIMNNFLMLFMDHWLMNLSYIFLMDDWLMEFMDNVLMLFMNYVFVVLMNNVLMMFMNNLFMVFLDDWLVDVSLNLDRHFNLVNNCRNVVSLKDGLLFVLNNYRS